jgi:DNA-binding NarL/FixJ family response regulator
MGIRVLLVDDHALMRSGLRALMERESDVEVVAEAEDGRAAVRLAHEKSPDMVVMDVGMSGLNGIEATRQIVGAASGVRVIALSVHEDRRFVMGMLRAGASGYLLKGCGFEEVMRAVRAVREGQTYLSPRVAGVVVAESVNPVSKADEDPASVLTAREREMLQMLAEGKSTRQIADCLSVSVSTVETHRQHIMEKLNLYSIAELTKFAIRAGLTTI